MTGTTATIGDVSIRSPSVLIVTRAGDIHAHGIAALLRRRAIQVSVLEHDTLPGSGGLTWRIDQVSGPVAIIRAADGELITLDAVRLVWWRRMTGSARITDDDLPEARDLIERECRAAFLGALLSTVNARFISDPDATRRAENKLMQLAVATATGLRVPRILVSSDPVEVRTWCNSIGEGNVIVKALSGTPLVPTLTGRVTRDIITDSNVSLAPAIYQELIPGTDHLRVNIFGSDTHVALLRTERLDWRYPLDCVVEQSNLEPKIILQLQDMLDRLGLRMGIFDLKLADGGEPYWLEVNPQGQFLWLEGMSGMPLADAFTDFLQRELESLA